MVKVDKEKCIGCGVCPNIAPDIFEMPDGEKAQVKKGAKKDLQAVKAAIEACPTDAISS